MGGWPGAALFYLAGAAVGFLAFWNLPTSSPGTTLKQVIGAAVLIGLGRLCQKLGSTGL